MADVLELEDSTDTLELEDSTEILELEADETDAGRFSTVFAGVIR